MNTQAILNELRAERDRIDKAISALEALGETGTRSAARGRRRGPGRPPGRRRRSGLTPEGRKRLSEQLKARWAARKKKLGKNARL